MKEIHAPLLAKIAPVVLECLDAGREFFGVASVSGAEISADQAEMKVYISCERDLEGACKFAKKCVRDVVEVLRRSKLLRAIPYVTFRPSPQDAVRSVGLLLDQAGAELARAQAKEKEEAKAAATAPTPKAAPAAKAAPATPVKKAAAKPVAKDAAKKPAAKAVPAKKPAAKPVKKAAAKTAPKKAPAKKAVVSKVPAKKPAAKAGKAVPAKKASPASKRR